MNDYDTSSKLPGQIVNAISGIPQALIPSFLKALDRLVSASVDIPIAWLEQKKKKIEAQTQSYLLIEAEIAKFASAMASSDPAIIRRAANTLVRSAYRKQENRESIAKIAAQELSSVDNSAFSENDPSGPSDTKSSTIDDDWLNVFERFAEDVSTEKMQELWGRILAKEIRKPGMFSVRTLRFLSEFSKDDALIFAAFAESAFKDISPVKLSKPPSRSDVRDLAYLESLGLIHGASGLGLETKFTFSSDGNQQIFEDNVCIVLFGTPGVKVSTKAILLTPLGKELICLLPGRKKEDVAKRVALSMRCDSIHAASLGRLNGEQIEIIETIW